MWLKEKGGFSTKLFKEGGEVRLIHIAYKKREKKGF